MENQEHRNPAILGDPPFPTLSPEEIYATLQTSPAGLSANEEASRRETYGPNDISRVRKRPAVIRYLEHFKNVLVLILLLAAIISIFVGDIESAVIIIIIVLISVTLDFYQENKAGNAAELLRQKIISHAAVIREGREEEIPLVELVPGDIIVLSAGDIVPADARILSERDLFLNQSALTGEPFPVGGAGGERRGGDLSAGDALARVRAAAAGAQPGCRAGCGAARVRAPGRRRGRSAGVLQQGDCGGRSGP